MAAGDVETDLVKNWTAASVDTALTTLRTTIGANGTWQAVLVNGGLDMLLIGIVEA